jgi:hypothetical protein
MRAISYTLIAIGFILVTAAEGFCIGLVLSTVISSLPPHGDDLGAFLEAVFLPIMIVACTFLSALFQVPLLWQKVRPDLTNSRAVGSSDQ